MPTPMLNPPLDSHGRPVPLLRMDESPFDSALLENKSFRDAENDLRSAPILLRLSDVTPKPIDWLWHNRIPAGRITLLAGPPGDGKSFLALDLAARVSSGAPWPDGAPNKPASVLILAPEDDLADTLQPRLAALGADLSRIQLMHSMRRFYHDSDKWQEVPFNLTDHSTLETALKGMDDCRLIIVDPIAGFLTRISDPPRTADDLEPAAPATHWFGRRDLAAQPLLAPLLRMVNRHGAALILIARGRKIRNQLCADIPLDRKISPGIARAVWHITRDPDDPERRLLIAGKTNLCAKPDGLAFRIDGAPPKILWEKDPLAKKIDTQFDIRVVSTHRRELDVAVDWLLENLTPGKKRLTAELKADAIGAEINWRTIQRAACLLRVKRARDTHLGPYYWQLPDAIPQFHSKNIACQKK